MTTAQLPTLAIAPAQVVRGDGILTAQGAAIPGGIAARIARLGQRPLIVGGSHSLRLAAPLIGALAQASLTAQTAPYGSDCSEATLARLRTAAADHRADLVIGIGGGKALDAASADMIALEAYSFMLHKGVAIDTGLQSRQTAGPTPKNARGLNVKGTGIGFDK